MLGMTKRYNRRKAEVSATQDPSLPGEGREEEPEEEGAGFHPHPRGPWRPMDRVAAEALVVPTGAATEGEPGGDAVCGAQGPQGAARAGDTLPRAASLHRGTC